MLFLAPLFAATAALLLLLLAVLVEVFVIVDEDEDALENSVVFAICGTGIIVEIKLPAISVVLLPLLTRGRRHHYEAEHIPFLCRVLLRTKQAQVNHVCLLFRSQSAFKALSRSH